MDTSELWRLFLPELVDWEKHRSEKVKIAIVGFGKMGILHAGILNLLNPGCVTAIIERSRILSYAASKVTKKTKVLRNLDDLQKKVEVDAAFVTTPAGSHHLLLGKLLDSGVPRIFVEKPPTMNLGQLLEVKRAMSSSQVVMVGLQKRYALPFRHAQMLLSEGVVGDIKNIRAYAKSSDITSPTSRFDSLGRGALLDLGIHVVDLLTWLFDITRVVNARQQSLVTGVDDTFEAELRTREGIPITLEVTWSDKAYRLPETKLSIEGSLGTLTVADDLLRLTRVDNETLSKCTYRPDYYQSIPPVYLGDQEYALEDMHFLQCVTSSMAPATTLSGATTTMSLIDQMYERAVIPSG
jgi:predicted dehydrogenase